MKTSPSPSEQLVLDWLKQHYSRTNEVPLIEDIASGLFLTPNTVKSHLRNLRRKGFVRRDEVRLIASVDKWPRQIQVRVTLGDCDIYVDVDDPVQCPEMVRLIRTAIQDAIAKATELEEVAA